eukprot:6375927-Pyramimonas_sp.AAC.3
MLALSKIRAPVGAPRQAWFTPHWGRMLLKVYIRDHKGRSKGEQQQHERSDHDSRLTSLRLFLPSATSK